MLAQKPWAKQLEVERQVFEGKHKRTEVSGCVGSTKTTAAAIIALQWLCAYKPSRVFAIAPSFRQVESNLWGYIKQLWSAAKANGTPLGLDTDIFKIPKIVLGDGWGFEGFSTDEPHNVHGLHGENDLVIIDDGHGIKRQLTDELENITAGGNTRILMLYNKMVLSGPTYDCNHVEAKHWNHVGIAYTDLAAARKGGYKLDGALGADAVERWGQKYGPESNFFRTKVLNLYPKQENDTLIPLDWIELAFDRTVGDTGNLVLGCDVASEGDDFNAKAPMRGLQVGPIEEWQEPDTMATVGRFVAEMKAEEAHVKDRAQTSRAFAFMDSVGLGGPMVKRMAEQTNLVKGHSLTCVGCQERIKIVGLNGAESAEGRVLDGAVMRDADEVFKNKRTQIFWNLREALNPANANLIGLTRDDDLAAQLSCIKWRVGSDGRKEVEPKIGVSLSKGGTANWGIKRRLGFSPDKADAVAYAVWGASRAVHGEIVATSNAHSVSVGTSERFHAAPLPDAGAFLDGVEIDGGLE